MLIQIYNDSRPSLISSSVNIFAIFFFKILFLFLFKKLTIKLYALFICSAFFAPVIIIFPVWNTNIEIVFSIFSSIYIWCCNIILELIYFLTTDKMCGNNVLSLENIMNNIDKETQKLIDNI